MTGAALESAFAYIQKRQEQVCDYPNIQTVGLGKRKTQDDVIEAIDDVITDCKDHSMDFTFDDEDHYGSYERETDFTQLVID